MHKAPALSSIRIDHMPPSSWDNCSTLGFAEQLGTTALLFRLTAWATPRVCTTFVTAQPLKPKTA